MKPPFVPLNFAILAVSLVFAGCDKPIATGAGATTTIVETDAGKVALATVYGFTVATDRLAFAFFTDLDREDTVSTVGSSWRGQIARRAGNEVLTFEGTSEGIEINGTQFDFSSGRIFIATHSGDVFSVTQVEIPLEEAGYEAEIDRLRQRPEIQDALAK